MADGDLFSAGFAWPADEEVSQTIATPVATPEVIDFTPKTVAEPQSVASVASVAFYLNAEVADDDCRNFAATPIATPETAEIRRVQPSPAAPVATVACVANWSQGVAMLAGASAPFGISPRAWALLVRDAKAIANLWADQLTAAGWSTLDVFGVPRQPGARRLDCVGLVAVLDGRAVMEISPTHAVIQATARDRTRFDRTLRATGAVPLWNWLTMEGL